MLVKVGGGSHAFLLLSKSQSGFGTFLGKRGQFLTIYLNFTGVMLVTLSHQVGRGLVWGIGSLCGGSGAG